MTIELEIEKAIVDFLKHEYPGLAIEALSEDIVLLIDRARSKAKGLVVVSHSNQPADYTMIPAAYGRYVITERYVITILSNSRRDNEGVAELIDKFRKTMQNFVWRNRRMKQLSHSISPQKFPDIKDGVYIGDLEFEIEIKYPIDN